MLKKKEKVFDNTALNTQFLRHGYCTIKDFISQGTIDTLTETFYRHLDKAQLDIPFFTTHWSSNAGHRKEVHSSVNELLLPAILQVLANYKSIFGYYLVKMPCGGNHTPIHQDWTLCNEKEHIGLTFWCPLTDVNLRNGCFQVVDGSHLFYHNIRGTNIGSPYSTFGNFIEEKNLTSLEIKKGTAVFFDHRLMHASPPNLSKTIRIAAGMVLLPKMAAVEHYLKEGENVYRYQCDDEFLLSFHYNYRQPEKALFDKSKYKLIETMPYQSNSSTAEAYEMNFIRK